MFIYHKWYIIIIYMVYKQLEKTDYEVLIFLIENLNKEYSIKEISQSLKKPYVKIHSSINRLLKQKIIKEEIKGRSRYCSIDYINNLDVVCFINSQKASNFLAKNKKISIVVEDIIKNIKFSNYSIVLFGSYAKGKADKHSDLDIAIITSEKGKEESDRVMNFVKRLSSLKIHSLEFTYENFIEMLKSKENSVGKEMLKNHIIFKGCEQFYDCLRLSQ